MLPDSDGIVWKISSKLRFSNFSSAVKTGPRCLQMW